MLYNTANDNFKHKFLQIYNILAIFSIFKLNLSLASPKAFYGFLIVIYRIYNVFQLFQAIGFIGGPQRNIKRIELPAFGKRFENLFVYDALILRSHFPLVHIFYGEKFTAERRHFQNYGNVVVHF